MSTIENLHQGGLTPDTTDDLIELGNEFLQTEREVDLDSGDSAVSETNEQIYSVEDAARDLLRDDSIDLDASGLPGFRAVLSGPNANKFELVAATLPGYDVLIPSSLVPAGDPKDSDKMMPGGSFMPGKVSPESDTDTITIRVMAHPFHVSEGLPFGARLLTDGAVKYEHPSIGQHDDEADSADGSEEHAHEGETGKDPNEVEAEHLPTLFLAGVDVSVRQVWEEAAAAKPGAEHPNHLLRRGEALPGDAMASSGSVTEEIYRRTPGLEDLAPQRTVTVSKHQVETGQAAILWHETMTDTGTPEAQPLRADNDDAILAVQGLAFFATKEAGGLPAVHDLIQREAA